MKRLLYILTLTAMVVGIPAQAGSWYRKTKKKHIRVASAKPLPLMPNKDQSRTPDFAAPGYIHYGPQKPRRPIELGFELGTFGRENREATGFLGMEYLVGGRVFVQLPLKQTRWELRPSIGYFKRSDEEAQVSVSQTDFEFGLGVLYTFTRYDSKIRLKGGLSNRIDLLRSSISVLGSESESAPFLFRYRLGPTLGMEARLGSKAALHLNAESTLSIASPMRFHVGLAAGSAGCSGRIVQTCASR